MNSDFQEAFEDRCPQISIVFDYFRIVKNFNDMVVSEVRKDVQRELIKNGETEQARLLIERSRVSLRCDRVGDDKSESKGGEI